MHKMHNVIPINNGEQVTNELVKVIDGKLKLPSGHGLDLTLNPEYKKDFNNLK